MSAKNISLRARNLNAEPIKVNDRTGNPVLIGLVLVWKIKREEIYKAVFDIDAPATAVGAGVSASDRMRVLENFVGVQSDAALRQVAGCYAYDNNSGGEGELISRSVRAATRSTASWRRNSTSGWLWPVSRSWRPGSTTWPMPPKSLP